MSQQRRILVPITVTAVLTASLTAAGPSLAAAVHDAVNADKVDGRHAVGPGATPAQRRRKLVATNAAGRLPNNIIAKAPNADRLDGLDATAFLPLHGTAANSSALGGRPLGQVRPFQVSNSAPSTPLAAAVQDLVSVSIAAPSAGRVVVSAVVGVQINKPDALSAKYGDFWIKRSDSPTPTALSSHELPLAAPAGVWHASLHVLDTFEVPPGNHTYMLIGRGSTDFYARPVLQAQFFPTG